MAKLATSRSARRLAAPRLAALLLAAGLLPAPAAAQAFLPGLGFGGFGASGFGPLPAFAWPDRALDEDRWNGAYARMSAGFEAVSSRRFGGYAGPTIGFEGGRLWREGPFVYGISGGFDYLAAGGGGTPGFGRLGYSRDFAGALQVKVGALVASDVLVYARAGAVAVNERWRLGPTAHSLSVSRSDIAVRPEAGIGVEWAVNERVTLAVEAGVVGHGLR